MPNRHTITTSHRIDVYQIINDRILAILEHGTIPWKKPWLSQNGQEPCNLISRKPYRGINRFLLAHSGESPYWLTYKQAKDLGGQVRKGEKATPVVFWKWPEKEEADEENTTPSQRAPLLKYYNVFNLSQCDGIEAPSEPEPEPQTESEELDDFATADLIIKHMPNPPRITHKKSDRACYRPSSDTIQMPTKTQFKHQKTGYYETIFHEITHSTGHHNRLARKGITDSTASFGSAVYSQEELVAEMGAAFLCAHGGVTLSEAMIDNAAAYVEGWMKVIKADKKLLVTAAAQAQKAAEYVLGNLANDKEPNSD